ncbi:translation machinery-associated protein 16 [Paramarasmius palmivorus]|uniref:Translation machinery-associated protein 16 n=1 Tax=Paramarasmius palmivorus TaxID=297713 RepID=A0AAW0EB83_9AGAR
MAPSKTGKSSASKPAKKEKVFHPESRKAAQLNRRSLRKEKMGSLASNRKQKHHSLADIYKFFYSAIPEEGVLSLTELHDLIANVWLKRLDNELEEERTLRRKGRPKSVKEAKLEELKLREEDEYRTGFEVIDLTNPANVDLFRKWDQKQVAYIDLLRFIRITSTNPESVVVSRPGKHASIVKAATEQQGHMDVDQSMEHPITPPIIATEPPQRFASTIMAMDEPIS